MPPSSLKPPGMDASWDPYGIKSLPKGSIKRELSRMRRLATKHHDRCPDCEILRCKNPYEPILWALEDRLAELERKPIKFRAYLGRIYGKLLALWKVP